MGLMLKLQMMNSSDTGKLVTSTLATLEVKTASLMSQRSSFHGNPAESIIDKRPKLDKEVMFSSLVGFWWCLGFWVVDC